MKPVRFVKMHGAGNDFVLVDDRDGDFPCEQPTPVFLPGESQGWRSLVGCHLWGRTESDTTVAT